MIATRVPYQPSDFAAMLDAHDDFHQVGMRLEKRIDAHRSLMPEYSLTVIRKGDKLYFSGFARGVPQDAEYRDGTYQPIITGHEGNPNDEKESSE
ncbi:MAG: hypothetical protein H0U59_11060 [Gemmatimonadaceae bacterium]|nr:hypothetical protein [Gemmatimonadaceae bacterium]